MLAKKQSYGDEHGAPDNLVQLEDLQRKLSSSIRQFTEERSKPEKLDPPDALDLVFRAADAIDVLERRAKDVETWALKTIQQLQESLAEAEDRQALYEDRVRATENLARELQSRLAMSEQRCQRTEELLASAQRDISALENRSNIAEERAQAAEEKAAKCEAWLAHAREVITSKLSHAGAMVGELGAKTDVAHELQSKMEKQAGRGFPARARLASSAAVAGGGET